MTAEEVAATQEAADELTSEDLKKVNGGRIHYNPNSPGNRKDRAIPNERGASGGW